MPRRIEWWKVLSVDNGKRKDLTICGSCLGRRTFTVLNRVFGASQTCAICGATDRKEEPSR